MALLNLRKDTLTFVLVRILALAVPSTSRPYGSCGEGPGYCGTSSPLANIVTLEFFDGIKNQSDENCAGRNFYKIDSFLNAAPVFPDFGKGSVEDTKREVAAYFAHVTHQTQHLCYVEETDKSDSYCDQGNTQYPCAYGKYYYGRGPLQLTGNYNYGACGKALGFDGINCPETLAYDPVLSFKSSLWYWTTQIHPVVKQGFGATIRKFHGSVECHGKQSQTVHALVGYYKDYCNKFGTSAGENLYC